MEGGGGRGGREGQEGGVGEKGEREGCVCMHACMPVHIFTFRQSRTVLCARGLASTRLP